MIPASVAPTTKKANISPGTHPPKRESAAGGGTGGGGGGGGGGGEDKARETQREKSREREEEKKEEKSIRSGSSRSRLLEAPEDAMSKRVSEDMWDPVERDALKQQGKVELKKLNRSNSDLSVDSAESSASSASSNASVGHFRSKKRRKARRLLVTHTMGLQPSSALQLVIESGEDIHAAYDLDAGILGEGAFGVVRRGVLKATGAVRAVKAISKKKMQSQQAMVKLEIEIMKMLDHPNLLMLFEVMEDSKYLYLVLEICGGGSLSGHIEKGPLKEKVTANVMQQLLRGTNYLHKHDIMHRDLKADNVLIDKSGPLEHALLKLADFGLSCRLEQGRMITRPAGTPTHMAPEVFAKRYSHPADLWSVGIICFVSMCGNLPWIATTREELAKKVTHDIIHFHGRHWQNVSQHALEFISHLLAKSAKHRFTASDALKDKWITTNELALGKAKLPWKVIEDLRKFRSRNRFKRAALHVIASMLGDEEVREQRRAFLQLDRDGDGFFTVEELRDSLRRMVFAPGTGDLEETSKASKIDLGSRDGSGSNDAEGFTYTEFLAATFDMRKALQMGLCQAAFASFDKNKDGAISISELATGKMLGRMTMDEVVETMESLDVDGNCELDYGEFVKMMRGETLASLGSAEGQGQAQG